MREQGPPGAPTVVANLTAPLLRACAKWLGREAPKHLVCSGMLAAEADAVAGAFAVPGLREHERRRDGDWCALLLQDGDE